ncbi:hypothetical protein KKC16_01600 [Patescibacteria group bacterium]|nr:hypothetical protein [Patescibacteria group bacterium]
MYMTVHTPTALLIGVATHNPILAFVLAFISHFLLDIIPHDSIKTKDRIKNVKHFLKLGSIDLICLFGFLVILYFTKNLDCEASIIAAIIGAVLPDFIWGINMLTNKKIKILNLYSIFHSKIIDKKIVYPFVPTWVAFITQTLIFTIPLWVYLIVIHY